MFKTVFIFFISLCFHPLLVQSQVVVNLNYTYDFNPHDSFQPNTITFSLSEELRDLELRFAHGEIIKPDSIYKVSFIDFLPLVGKIDVAFKGQHKTCDLHQALSDLGRPGFHQVVISFRSKDDSLPNDLTLEMGFTTTKFQRILSCKVGQSQLPNDVSPFHMSGEYMYRRYAGDGMDAAIRFLNH